MASTIQFQGTTAKLQTVPGSSVVGVTLPGDSQRHYNPVTQVFDTAPMLANTPLAPDSLQALTAELDFFAAERKAHFASLRRTI